MAVELDPRQHDFDRLRLIRSSNIGPVTYFQLIRRFGNAMRALKALPELAKKGGRKGIRIANPQKITEEIKNIKTANAKMLFWGDEQYPSLLAQLHNAPPVLIWRGSLDHLRKPSIAIVGARNASAAACRFARELARDLCAANVAVVSGLARGIDTAAHQGALKRSTIGVIAGGINVAYPPENEQLQERIATDGLLISEQSPGTEPRARHFPYRNRIIAGLVQGTVVVEAAPRSGSLITARLSNDAGRHVMAIPGSPLDPRSRGCNSLIREGAVLVQSAEDVIEQITHFDERADIGIGESSTPSWKDVHSVETNKIVDVCEADRMTILNLLSATSVQIDELIRQANLSPSAVQLILLELELAGRLDRHAGARVSLKS